MGSAWRRGNVRDRAPRLMFTYLRLALVIEVEKGIQRNLEAQPLRPVGVDGGRWLGEEGGEDCFLMCAVARTVITSDLARSVLKAAGLLRLEDSHTGPDCFH